MGAPLVGRIAERAALRDAQRDARAGHGRLVLLCGPAGMGKTALADAAAADAAEAGFTVLWGSGWEAGGAPAYRPWVQALRALARRRGAAVLAPAADRLAELVPELTPGAEPPAVGVSDGARYALFDAVWSVLAAAAADEPVLLVLDDLHVAGGPSVELLTFAAAELGRTPMLVLATHRPVERDRADGLGTLLAGLQRSATVLSLAGLARPEVDELVARTTGAPPERRLGERIVARTEGNPLFVGEVARLIAATGGTDPRGWPVPIGIRQAIRARVDALPPDTAAVLAAAAVLGRRFDLAALAELVALPVDVVADRLDVAVHAELLVADGPGAHRFSHDLVRETVHTDLPPRERAGWHARAVAVLETSPRTDPASRMARLAHHALAAVPVLDGAVAARHAVAAGERAMRAYAFDRAAELAEGALAALDAAADEDAPLRRRVLLDLAEALIKGGDPPRARRLLRTAAELARRAGDRDGLARAALLATERIDFNDVDEEALALLAEAVAGRRGEGSAQEARLSARLAVAGYHADPGMREAHADAAVRAARACGDPATLALVMSARLYMHWGRLPPTEMLTAADEIVGLAERAGDLEKVIDGRIWRVVALLQLGELNLVERELHAVTRAADRLGQPLHRLVATSRASTVAVQRGQFEAALEYAGAAREIGRRGREPDADAVYWGQVFAVAEHTEVPAADAAEMERILRELVAGSPLSTAHTIALVLHCLRTGRAGEARSRYDTIVRRDLAALPHDMVRTWTLTQLAVACAAFGDRATARRLVPLLEPEAGRFAVCAGATACSGAVDHYLGLLEQCLGRPDAAAAHLARAARQHAAAGADGMLAMTRRAQAALAQPAPPAAAPPAAEPPAAAPSAGTAAADGVPPAHPVLTRDGDVWTVAWAGHTARVRHLKGMSYLALLLAVPGREISALDLVRATTGPAGPAADRDTAAGLHVDGAGPGEPVLDQRARTAYRARLAELVAERDEARDWHDVERAARLDVEIDFLARELGAALGRGGRPRTLPTDAERARISVTRAVRAAIARIAAVDPGIGEHLDTAVVTGGHCRYRLPVSGSGRPG